MRHSFGSYHFAMYADSIKTSNELGHKQGDNVLFSHYRALSTKEKSEQYFKIVPSVISENIVESVS
jgi:co-chaperonin GroES (HSP10)